MAQMCGLAQSTLLAQGGAEQALADTGMLQHAMLSSLLMRCSHPAPLSHSLCSISMALAKR